MQSNPRIAAQCGLEPIRFLDRDAAWRLLNPHLRGLVELPERVPVYAVRARDLMNTSSRFDIFLKYLCVYHWKEEGDLEWFQELYIQHIAAFTNHSFVEGDGRKYSPDDYLSAFREVIYSIDRNGFDPEQSLVPINPDGQCIDGSHRVAVAAYFDEFVWVAEINAHVSTYDHAFFAEKGLGEQYRDYVALEYCLAEDSARVVNLHPVAKGRDGEVDAILAGYGRVFCKKTIQVRGRLPERIVKMYYAGEYWIGDEHNKFSGARAHATRAFQGRLFSPARIYVISGADDEDLREAKRRIRDIYGLGNYSVHINDDHLSTCTLARIWFNRNSIEYLSNFHETHCPNFEKYSIAYKAAVTNGETDVERYCVDGSAVMSAWGIRDCRDFDYLSLGGENLAPSEPAIECHNHQSHFYPQTIRDLIFDPRNHFYRNGVKFVTLDLLANMKSGRGEAVKDTRDLRLIQASKALIKCGIHGALVVDSLNKVFELWGKGGTISRRVLNRVLRLYRYEVYRDVLALLFRNKYLSCPFLGYRVFYRRGNSRILKLKRSGVFRPECSAMVMEPVKSRARPTILDVGDTTGLSAISLIRALPGAFVYVCNLREMDTRLLERTILHNELCDSIGLVDRGTDGGVECALDALWEAAGKPMVALLNIAEDVGFLDLLQGENRLIKHCRPMIIVHRNSDDHYEIENCDRIGMELYTLGYRAFSEDPEQIEGFREGGTTASVCAFKYAN